MRRFPLILPVLRNRRASYRAYHVLPCLRRIRLSEHPDVPDNPVIRLGYGILRLCAVVQHRECDGIELFFIQPVKLRELFLVGHDLTSLCGLERSIYYNACR